MSVAAHAVHGCDKEFRKEQKLFQSKVKQPTMILCRDFVLAFVIKDL